MASALMGRAFSVPSISLKMTAPSEKTSLTTKGPSYLYENFPRESGVTFHRHFFDDLLDVLLRRFHRTVHLGTVRGGVAVSDFELCTELIDDLVVQVLGIVGDDCRRDLVPGDDVASEKTGHGFCGD
ncbi:hypothetical protein CRG98_037186 [Punica granatum]|uniref:Uncharacterized protein n=1 Tax=Punica granatum TaxID=22663 RepID=A0A2I0IFF5_PUNGR|nr:hypothetical protein CRG98_037186 [Punica granatum]